ncbi:MULTISPECIES: tryptophan synthase subunit beta [unclassified Lentimicrobium]|uniref:tryptophan synthase subunit beta n=1 Tax=unclassified Lentimicrobium TaxID=2677434 RepID=UPI001551E1E7|nr:MULTISPECIES: tryptophan synthase subunit beta [unclassified Lentimicrobium]NPD47129.1 tryptophan synthase subunit beta [Lentimicrobium sp. S6]NPD83770.1 tryptophan synthase subunit beta [Lentimicrobium sp. L6]
MENITTKQTEQDFASVNGKFGDYGGMFVPPVLEGKLLELAEQFEKYSKDSSFEQEYIYYLKNFVGRPSPLYYAHRLSQHIGSKVYLKREDLNHTGSHKINNTIGQILLAKRMGATEIVAETGAGQHGVATATAAALFGMKCKVFMGAKDAERQKMNVSRIKLLGAEMVLTESGTATLKDAVDAALGYYIENPHVFYLLGSQVGPHPYPTMVGFFQSVIGKETKKQFIEKEGRLPDNLFACIGGGSNAIGLFGDFLKDREVAIHAAEGGGNGVLGDTAATLSLGKPGVFQGTFSYALTDENDEIYPSHSIAAGLDYPGVSPQHALLKDTGRAHYHIVTDDEAIEGFKLLSKLEGIIPAIESSHAIALAAKLLKGKTGQVSVINLSGRGDKDVERDLM